MKTSGTTFAPALVATIFLSFFSVASCAEAPEGKISVEGVAQVQVVPDEIHFTVGVNANEITAAKAYQVAESRMAEAMRILRRIKIPEQNVQAVSISLTPVIDYKNQNEVI